MHTSRLVRVALAGLLLTGAALAAASPAAAVTGLVYRSDISAFDSETEKSATASCPTGTRVLGGGGSITGADSHVHLTRLQPSGISDTYTAVAVERSAYAANWRVNAYAICGNAPAGLEYVSFHTGSDSEPTKEATASCTGSKKLIGLGARIEGGSGQVVIDDMKPFGPLTSARVVAYEGPGGYDGSWHMWAYGVCANPLAGLEVKWAATDDPMDSQDDTVSVACPVGKKVHGVGGLITGALGEVSFSGVYPAATLNSATVVAAEEPNGYLSNWWSEVFVICAT